MQRLYVYPEENDNISGFSTPTMTLYTPALSFTTIDNIVNSIQDFKDLDLLLYKIDVARSFCNLRVDPADAVSWVYRG